MAEKSVRVDIKAEFSGFGEAPKELDRISLAFDKTGAAARRVEGDLTRVENGAQKIERSLGSMARVAVAAFAGWQIGRLIRDVTLLTARADTLGVVLQVVGNNAGYTRDQMNAFVEAVREKGITLIGARQAVIDLAQADIDLAHSADLARIAQDAAVIANINSTEAFNRMIYGIKSGQVEVLRTMGLNVQFQTSYERLADALGKTTNDLTDAERAQARANVVMQAGTQIAGAYEAAMDTAGKQLNSTARLIEEAQRKIGEVFQESLIVGVKVFTEWLIQANTELDNLSANDALDRWATGLTDKLVFMADAVNVVVQGWGMLLSLVTADSWEEFNREMDMRRGRLGQFQAELHRIRLERSLRPERPDRPTSISIRGGGAGGGGDEEEAADEFGNLTEMRLADQAAHVQAQIKAYEDAVTAAIKAADDAIEAAQKRGMETAGFGEDLFDAEIEGRLKARDAADEYITSIRHETDLMSANARERQHLLDTFYLEFIGLEAGTEAWQQYVDAIAQARAVQDAMNASWEYGAQRAAVEYVDAVKNVSESSERLFTQAFSNMEDAMVEWTRTGKLSFEELGRDFEAMVRRMFVQQQIMGPLASAFGGLFSNSSADTVALHSGGIVGTDGAPRTVDPAVFAGAPRFHAGGLVDGEVPIIARRGEGVFTREQMQAMGGRSVRVEIVNQGAPSQVERAEPHFDAEGMVVRIVLRDLQVGGPIRSKVRELQAPVQ